jgi:hypothetical protein
MDVATTLIEKFPPLMRPNAFRTDVMPMSTTRLYELRKRGLLQFVYVDGQPFVVTASAAKLLAESLADPDQSNVDAAARARAGKTTKRSKR